VVFQRSLRQAQTLREARKGRDAEGIGGRRRRPMIDRDQPRMNANGREWAPLSSSVLRDEALTLAATARSHDARDLPPAPEPAACQ